ncbi:hypothetical protein [Clostridium saccharoperbutylacetonicum]
MNDITKVVAMGNKDEDDLFQALKKIEKPVEIGTVLMYYIVNNHPKEKRVEVIKDILERFTTDFLVNELPKGELERLRKIIDKI